MIHSYCRSCGLFISVQEEFAGGKGACPRCKTELRIPRPWPPETPGWTEGFRYFAEPIQTEPPVRAELVTDEFGRSSRYRCAECGERYESLPACGGESGCCPRCGSGNEPVVREVIFPRAPGGELLPAAASPDEDQWEMTGEFLLALPAADQTPGDDVIAASPWEEESPRPQPREKELHAAMPPDMKASGAEEDVSKPPPASAPAPPAEKPARPDSASPFAAPPEEGWSYLMKGQQHGPVSTNRVQELLREGKINRSVLVWRKGMAGWTPLETVTQLTAGQAAPTEPRAAAPRVVTTEKTSSHGARTLWVFLIALGALLVLTLARSGRLFDTVTWAFPLATSIFALVCLVVVIVGVLQAYRTRTAGIRLPMGLRLQRLAGLAGLGGCVVAAVLMVLVPGSPQGRTTSQNQRDRVLFEQAQRVFDVLTRGDIEATYTLVDWDQLRSGVWDFALLSVEDRPPAIQKFVAAFPETFNPDKQSGASLADWRVEGKTPQGTEISAAYAPGARKRVVFTLQSDWLVGIRRK